MFKSFSMHSFVLPVIWKHDKVCFIRSCRNADWLTDDVQLTSSVIPRGC